MSTSASILTANQGNKLHQEVGKCPGTRNKLLKFCMQWSEAYHSTYATITALKSALVGADFTVKLNLKGDVIIHPKSKAVWRKNCQAQLQLSEERTSYTADKAGSDELPQRIPPRPCRKSPKILEIKMYCMI